jgi:ABC-type lipoprotein release transport system permease subunit
MKKPYGARSLDRPALEADRASFVAVAAIVVGTALGLVLGYNIISDSAKQPNWDTLTLAVPWLDLAATFLVVYAVALLTTLASALRASRVQPAEALRYQ